MKIVKEVREGEMIPPWYGVAWIEWEANIAICYPAPLNLVIAALRGVSNWMRFGYRAIPRASRHAYAQGVRDGKRASLEKLKQFEEAENIAESIRSNWGK